MLKQNSLLPAILIFAYMFAPMLFSVPAPVASSQSSIVFIDAASPLIADRIDVDSEFSDDPFAESIMGQGGPLDFSLFGDLRDEQASEPPFEPEEVLYSNKLHYSNAVYPVFPADISSAYGWREAPCEECSTDHHGVDFVPGHGAEVVSILDGLVIEAGKNGGYGTWVMIQHIVPSLESEGSFEVWHTIYAHLQEDSIPFNVGVGSIVEKGQKIGLVGSTGTSTGSHLHFEILIDGEPKDPIPLMSEYSRVEILEDGEERFIRYE
jgi:murein DD-endopeptidase MepM/ murein hydrolase activator NlpD